MTSSERRQAPALPPPGRQQVGGGNWEETRRRIYLSVNAVGMAVQVLIWALNLSRAEPDLITLISNPIFFVFCAWNLYWLHLRKPIEVTYIAALTICGLVIVSRAVVTPLLGGPALLSSLEDLYWLLVVVSIVTFLMLGYRRAIAVTAAFFVVSAAVPWAMLVLLDTPIAQAARLGQVQLLCGIVLMTLCSLAWYREHFALERQERLLTERAANTDALTGLSNRHALYPLLDAVLQGAGGTPAALLLIDIDHFKGVNDRLGHTVGDEVLISVAQTLRAHLRADDSLGRWGGEEFLVALPDITPEDAANVAERLCRAVAGRPMPDGQGVTISVGCTAVVPGENLQACVSRADSALYAAKAGGRNRVNLKLAVPTLNVGLALLPAQAQEPSSI